jgi:hypothetical protein
MGRRPKKSIMPEEGEVSICSPRDQILTQLNGLHAEMREEILASGIMQKHYDAVVVGLEILTNEQLERVRESFQLVHQTAYSDLMTIRKLKPTDWWKNMSNLFGQSNLREHKLLRDAQKKLRYSWRHRSGEKTETKQNGDIAGAEQISIRSETTGSDQRDP